MRSVHGTFPIEHSPLKHSDDVLQVAEFLLEQETINVDDVVKLIGERPHEMPVSSPSFNGHKLNLRIKFAYILSQLSTT